MNTYASFSVPGPILGYRASIARAFDPKYRAFKARVRALATQAGIPLDVPDSGFRLTVDIFWKKRARIDGKNVYAAIEDALFVRDRRVLRGAFAAFESHRCERVDVTVFWL